MSQAATKSQGLVPSALCHPYIWLVCWVVWVGVLWLLSGGPPPVQNEGAIIPHLDKVLHVGYFFGGTGLLSAFFWLVSRKRLRVSVLLAFVIILNGLVGATDEYHQSLNPDRTGNSFGDFSADIAGILLGIWVFWKCRKLAFGKHSG